MPDTTKADLITTTVIAAFDKLSSKRKPVVRSNGTREWIPLSGIVSEFEDGSLKCLCLATGTKCLPALQIREHKGHAIHDSHAEILALRAFNHVLLRECKTLLEGREGLKILRKRTESEVVASSNRQRFSVRDGVRFHLYCSEAPCGDASMELTMSSQENDTPWELPSVQKALSPVTPQTDEEPTLTGRKYFSQLGVVRRKPGRGDSPPSLSKSCSDKLALKQATSLLSSLASLILTPHQAYLDSLVLHSEQHNPGSMQRCFAAAGRMKPVSNHVWSGGYSFQELRIQETMVDFTYSKKSIESEATSIAPSNTSTIWTCHGLEESVINGFHRGKKPTDPGAASQLSRQRMWLMAEEIVSHVYESDPDMVNDIRNSTYGRLKHSKHLEDRREVKREVKTEALFGWIPNSGDDEFELDGI